MMKLIIKISSWVLAIIFSLSTSSCDYVSSTDSTIPFEEVKMECMDIVTIGDNLEVVVNSQQNYDELFYQRFQKPLDDYWNTHYESVFQSVRERNPGLTDAEYEELVKEIFYSVLPFRGTENCNQPAINFEKYTLLGQDAHSGGCETPDYEIEIEKIEKVYLFRVFKKQKGTCSMSIMKNKWVLIPKIPTGSKVIFEQVMIE